MDQLVQVSPGFTPLSAGWLLVKVIDARAVRSLWMVTAVIVTLLSMVPLVLLTNPVKGFFACCVEVSCE